MIMFERFPVLKNGEYTITFKNGYCGLIDEENSIILPNVFHDISWAGDYLCIFNGEKYAVIHITHLSTLIEAFHRKCIDK